MLKKEVQTTREANRWLPSNNDRIVKVNSPKMVYLGLRFKRLVETKYFITMVALLCIFLFTFGLVFGIGLNKVVNHTNITLIYILEIMMLSIVNITLAIYCIWKLFYDDNNDGVTKLEARIGLQKSFMYFYRLAILTILISFFLIIEYTLLAIFYAATHNKQPIFSYRLFLSPFSWLAFISFFTTFIALFITTIFKSRFTIIFSTIISIALLFVSSISGNFISNKVKLNNQNDIVLNQQKKSFEQSSIFSSLIELNMDDSSYLSVGFKFNNYFNFYQNLKIDNESIDGYKLLSFCREVYDNNLSDSDNLELFINGITENILFQNLNSKLIKINNLYVETKDNKLLIKLLQDAGDFILIKYSEILSNTFIYNGSSKFALNDNITQVQKDFFNYTFQVFLSCEKGLEVNILESSEIDLLDKFNSKMQKNVRLNPLYQLNLMLFGAGYDFELDNIINHSRPLFNQALNITYNLKFEEVNHPQDPSDIPRKWLVLTQVKHKPTINIGLLTTINVLIFILLSSLMYFGYKIRK
ncbi:hypothetical protein JN01_0699 [Entomoplasma freundtii]|uniref:Uncharacterized protein n=1 Tax=Entomoplasma freundtii TaxID=74700 RepID=A0A2K8NV27_9MOLU|nr:hypothetical protein [Entomoplasma freundtii]ATZ16483.1 hypothetical protein EFREU_v1c04570 [Entomoplasma freundtii]TDY56012.1 hypothetical protein JN01_0699 [Entomoplasma freundtii]